MALPLLRKNEEWGMSRLSPHFRIAQEFTGVAEKTALIREALKALIERESARRLASLGGTMPRLRNIPRRRVLPN